MSGGPSGPQSLLERAFTEARECSANTDATRTRLLDAAYEQFCRTGIQRSSVEDVAKRAGMSRITVYRRFATKDALVEHVILREIRRYFDQFRIDITGAETAADRLVVGFVSSLQAFRSNPLIGSLIATEPNLSVGAMVGDDGRMLAAVRQFVAGQLRREQLVGNIAEDLDTDLTAEVLVRISASFLTIRSHVVNLDTEEELVAVARQFLVPMLRLPPERS
ncbi:TetR family transcriptional regulator [Nocardia sp. 348MFTsu5.1]|uniref:TetR/AcrR family transcriptional regulator n=1 Tax=Nocardia sp. 348MFTsu5.1 TaxID=1172185 RepID=UPI000365AE3D